MAVGNANASGQLRGNINVTPLIDILLVLLTIFMVIAPVMPHGLTAALPQRSMHTNPRPDQPIVVQILTGQNGMPHYKIDQDDVSLDRLGSQLTSILSVRADKALFVKGDDNLDFSTVARVVDIGRSAGADHIGLITSKDAL